jgi:hypothetical protein
MIQWVQWADLLMDELLGANGCQSRRNLPSLNTPTEWNALHLIFIVRT